MRNVVIVKLGGSLITDKGQASTLRPEILSRLCLEIEASRQTMSEALIVAHGSGSFGHIAARRHSFSAERCEPVSIEGISEVQAQAHELHRSVMEALRAAGVPCFSFSPGSAMVGSRKDVSFLAVDPVCLALDQGLVPVTHGDVVLDRDRGALVCSTENAVLALVRGLPVDRYRVLRAIWMGETEGVYDAHGDTVPIIDLRNLRKALEEVGESTGTDVTGGMRLRIETAMELARSGVESYILSGLEAGALGRALLGEETPGTRIEAIHLNDKSA